MKSYWTLAYDLGAVPGYIGAALLLGLVLLRKTYYPRWTVIANTEVLSMLSPLAARASSPPRRHPRWRFHEPFNRSFLSRLSLDNLEGPPRRLKNPKFTLLLVLLPNPRRLRLTSARE